MVALKQKLQVRLKVAPVYLTNAFPRSTENCGLL